MAVLLMGALASVPLAGAAPPPPARPRGPRGGEALTDGPAPLPKRPRVAMDPSTPAQGRPEVDQDSGTGTKQARPAAVPSSLLELT